MEKKKAEPKKEVERKEAEKEAPKDNPWKKVTADSTKNSESQNWPSLSESKSDANNSGGEAAAAETKKEAKKVDKRESEENPKKKRGQKLDIEIGKPKSAAKAPRQRSTGQNGNGRKAESSKEEKEEEKKPEKAPQPVKTQKTSKRKPRGKSSQQPPSYPVDVTQQPWYPPYQQPVDPAQIPIEPNHIILDDEALKKALVLQIEYYFSDANLQKGRPHWVAIFKVLWKLFPKALAWNLFQTCGCAKNSIRKRAVYHFKQFHRSKE